MGARPCSAVLPMRMLGTGALPGAGPPASTGPHPSQHHPAPPQHQGAATGQRYRVQEPAGMRSPAIGSLDSSSDKCTDSPCRFLHIPGPCPSPSGSFTHTRSAAHHGQLCPQQATRSQAWATPKRCPSALSHGHKGHSQNLWSHSCWTPSTSFRHSFTPTKPWPSPPMPAEQGM